jgi:hypothetical protein
MRCREIPRNSGILVDFLQRATSARNVVRFALLLCLTLARDSWSAAEQADLQQENVRAIQGVMRKADASLDWFHVLGKKPVDATHAVMVVRAAPSELRTGGSKRSPVMSRSQIGVFVVSATDNQVLAVLDTDPLGDLDVTVDQPTEHAVCLYFPIGS